MGVFREIRRVGRERFLSGGLGSPSRTCISGQTRQEILGENVREPVEEPGAVDFGFWISDFGLGIFGKTNQGTGNDQ